MQNYYLNNQLFCVHATLLKYDLLIETTHRLREKNL